MIAPSRRILNGSEMSLEANHNILMAIMAQGEKIRVAMDASTRSTKTGTAMADFIELARTAAEGVTGGRAVVVAR